MYEARMVHELETRMPAHHARLNIVPPLLTGGDEISVHATLVATSPIKIGETSAPPTVNRVQMPSPNQVS